MRGQILWTISCLLLVSEANPILCKTLLKRSIARGQPFQLPLYDEEMSEYTFWRLQKLMSLHVGAGWVHVNQHNYTHAELLKLFYCC